MTRQEMLLLLECVTNKDECGVFVRKRTKRERYALRLARLGYVEMHTIDSEPSTLLTALPAGRAAVSRAVAAAALEKR